MARRCSACAWVLWRDCYNEQDCIRISQNNANYDYNENCNWFSMYSIDLECYWDKELIEYIKFISTFMLSRTNKKEKEEKAEPMKEISLAEVYLFN